MHEIEKIKLISEKEKQEILTQFKNEIANIKNMSEKVIYIQILE